MKKRLLFVIVSLRTGGICRALQNYLNRFDTEEYEIDVFAMSHAGVFNGELRNCRLLPTNRLIEASVSHLENQKGWLLIKSFLIKLINKATDYGLQRCLFRHSGKMLLRDTKYDAVIAYSEGLPSWFVSMMDHPNKIAWIHCDYSSYLKVAKVVPEHGVYESFSRIVCVSNYTKSSFVEIYPDLRNRAIAIYNILDEGMMRNKSKEAIAESFDDTCFNIVSVGRIDPVKRLSVIPEIANKVKESGCKIRWYVIGPKGTNDELIRLNENILKYEVSEIVIPLGEKANPYPYIAHADLLVNTSVSEACPYVVNEAKVLGTPVLCTDYGSAKEFIDYGVNGYYGSLETLHERIVSLVQNPELITQLKNNLMTFKYNNDSILSQISSVISPKPSLN